MTMLALFKNRTHNSTYIFKNGKTAHFLGGDYATSIPSEIEELTKEANEGSPFIYIDPEMTQVDSEKKDPLERLKAEMYAKAKADIMRATNPNNDMGAYDTKSFNQSIANSRSVEPAIVQSGTAQAGLQTNAADANTSQPLSGVGTSGSVPAGSIKVAAPTK